MLLVYGLSNRSSASTLSNTCVEAQQRSSRQQPMIHQTQCSETKFNPNVPDLTSFLQIIISHIVGFVLDGFFCLRDVIFFNFDG